MSSKRLLALVSAVAIFAAACGGSTATSPADQGSQAPGASPAAGGGDLADEQVLRLYYSAEDPHSIDPAIAETSTDILIVHALNRGLLYFDKDLNVVPSLAEALPEISEDGLTYTFKLRDAQYNNGDTIVADDLVYAWKRLIDPRTGSTYQAIISDVEGGQEILDLPEDASDADVQAAVDAFGVSAPDDKTFVVQFDHPTGYASDLAALWGTAPYQEKLGHQPGLNRGRELRQLRPVPAEELGAPVGARARAEPELVWRRQADAAGDPLPHRWRSGRLAGSLRGR